MIDQAGIRIAQGQAIACERIEGVNDNMAKSHYHDFYELYYLESGARYHIIQDSVFPISAGQLVIFTPYVMHHSYGSEDVPFKRIVLYFRSSEVQSPELMEALDAGGGVYTADARNRYSIHQLMELILREEDGDSPFKEEYMHSLLNVLLVNIFRQGLKPLQHEKKTLVGQVIDYIHKNYNEDITLELLSRRFYVSPYYLCREFKRCTNRTIIQYINVTRIMNAQRKIMETDKSITEIGNLTGFSNITHFNRVFKQYAGLTPSQYRKLSKKASIPSP